MSETDLVCRGCGRTVYYCRCRNTPASFPVACSECGAPAGEPCRVIGSHEGRRRNPPHLARLADEQDRKRAADLIAEGTCPKCAGDGVVFGPTPGHSGSPWEYKCDECRGTGKYIPACGDE